MRLRIQASSARPSSVAPGDQGEFDQETAARASEDLGARSVEDHTPLRHLGVRECHHVARLAVEPARIGEDAFGRLPESLERLEALRMREVGEDQLVVAVENREAAEAEVDRPRARLRGLHEQRSCEHARELARGVHRRYGDHDDMLMVASSGQPGTDERLSCPHHRAKVGAVGDVPDGDRAPAIRGHAHLALAIDPPEAAREQLSVLRKHALEVGAHLVLFRLHDHGCLGDRLEGSDLAGEDQVEHGRGNRCLRPGVLEVGPLGVLVLPPCQCAAGAGEEQERCQREQRQPAARRGGTELVERALLVGSWSVMAFSRAAPQGLRATGASS